MSASAKPEVLHYVGYDDDRGGIVSMIRALAASGRVRCVLGINPGCVQHQVPPLETVAFARVAGETIGPLNFFRASFVAGQVRAWLRADKSRVFHGHSRAGLLVGLWLSLWGETRVVVSVHCYGSQRWFYRWMHRWLGDRLVWYSPAMKRHYGCADRTWAGCMPNGVTLPLPAAMHAGPAAGAELRLGGAGAMVPWKRWDLVLHALAALPPGSRVRFVHIGGALETGESRACERELRELTSKLGLDDRVEWRGWRRTSSELVREVDAVVVPSDGEPFSMIALEALYAGRPVIATRGGGPEDFILEGINGWLVPAGDPAALAEQVQACIEPATWRSLQMMPEHLRKFSMSETLGDRWAEIYAAVRNP